MKSVFKILVIVLLISFMFPAKALAANSDIVIDGKFEDWKGKPYVEDPKKDVKSPWLDFLKLGYFADDKYLYLHVIRQAGKKSEPWTFNVIILNAVKGQGCPQYIFGSSNLVYASQFDVKVFYDGNKSHNGILVSVSFNGRQLENTFSSDNNAKEIEFRIPLSYVGLDGVNKEVKFVLKSEANGEIDWMPNRVITVTTGPTLWKVSYIFFFIAASASAYGIHKKWS